MWSASPTVQVKVRLAKVVAHARYTVFQMAEVAVQHHLFRAILEMINDLRCRQVAPC